MSANNILSDIYLFFVFIEEMTHLMKLCCFLLPLIRQHNILLAVAFFELLCIFPDQWFECICVSNGIKYVYHYIS